MAKSSRIILGIDPGLANTGWGIVREVDHRFECLAYGCVTTPSSMDLSSRLLKIYRQIRAVINKFQPVCAGIETVWFGDNSTSAFATGQARGAALVACAEGGLTVGEFAPSDIKLCVAGTGAADKHQIQYMVQQMLALESIPKPDHAADALACAITYSSHGGFSSAEEKFNAMVQKALSKDKVRATRKEISA